MGIKLLLLEESIIKWGFGFRGFVKKGAQIKLLLVARTFFLLQKRKWQFSVRTFPMEYTYVRILLRATLRE